MTLDEYLMATADTPWEWGRCDCMLWVADWIKARWGVDPAESLRGTYSDEAGAEAILDGDVLAKTFDLLPREWQRSEAREGDVAIIAVPRSNARVAAVWGGGGWIFKTPPQGIGMSRYAQPLAVWGKP